MLQNKLSKLSFSLGTYVKSIGRKIKEKQAIKMQLFSHHNPRTVQRGNAASVVGPVRGHSSITSSRFWLF